jgi:hypothetical protein
LRGCTVARSDVNGSTSIREGTHAEDNVGQSLKDPRGSLLRGDVRNANVVHRASDGMGAVIHMVALRITACALTWVCDCLPDLCEKAVSSRPTRRERLLDNLCTAAINMRELRCFWRSIPSRAVKRADVAA